MSDAQQAESAAERERLLSSWDEASDGWGRRADETREAAIAVSRWMLEHAGLRAGLRVLELGAGPGDTGFMAASQIGPDGVLISSDATQGMVELARERAARQGVANVEFKQLQLEWIDLPTASVDVVLVKWAVMLTVDPGAALRECRRVLRPGGRITLAVWDLPERNPWATVPQEALMQRGLTQSRAADAPGMFALSASGLLRELLEDAGFTEVEVEPISMPRSYTSVTAWIDETIDLSRSFRSVWTQLEEPDRDVLRGAIAELAAPFTAADGTLQLPAQSLGGAASA